VRMSLFTQGDLRSNKHYGYAKSFIKIQESFRKFKYNNKKIDIEWNSPRSKIQMYYGPHPVENSHYQHQYKIHMSQHESSMIFPHKVKAYGEYANEAWTANYWGAQSMINSGVPEKKVFIYEHALDPEEYKPFLRGKNEKIRFLHINSDSPRKRSGLVEEAFNILYEKNKNIELTLKYSHGRHKGISWLSNELLKTGGDWIRPGTRHIYETMSLQEMFSLMNFHDVLVYPSEGEGFGLIPLEALATGMPVISTYEWCSYSKFLIDGKIESDIKETFTDWGYPKIGKAVVPKFDSIVNLMQKYIDDIEGVSKNFYNQVNLIKEEYTWENKTNKVLNDLINRVGIDMFKTYIKRI
jgi:glycosyltransferase involved in cell wall biosynthesis